jgi:prolyl-tRNA synthetase
MKWSNLLLPTLKEDPAEAEAVSHRLMLRAGLIRKLSSGVYSYLPVGWRVLHKVEEIIRQEMNATGAQELLLPALQPAELWKESGRHKDLGEDMVSFIDRHKKEVVLGPTHEEVITDLVRHEIHSYKQLPVTLYQIQTKFRDEVRPRSGVIRSREFIMKDAYSFDRDTDGLNASYQKMFDAYCKIFSRCGLDFLAVEADPGIMGGDISHEFMVLTESGEDFLACCSACPYSAGLSQVPLPFPQENGSAGTFLPVKAVDTPDARTIEKVSQVLGLAPDRLVKTLIYEADSRPVAVLVRGDHEVNEAKLKRFLRSSNLRLAEPALIEKVTGCSVGFTGPAGLIGVRIIADYGVKNMVNFATGANAKDRHLINVNLERDFKPESFADLRYVREGDPCPHCKKKIKIKPALEIGHVFKLGTKYSKALNANFLDADGKEKPFIMGCYGIGVNRIIAAAIEQSHDEKGIIWPASISPFQVLILPVNVSHSETRAVSDEIYRKLSEEGVEALYDDRDERAGVKFNDADLLGIPLQVIIGEKNLKTGKVELKNRRTKEVKLIDKSEIVPDVLSLLGSPPP